MAVEVLSPDLTEMDYTDQPKPSEASIIPFPIKPLTLLGEDSPNLPFTRNQRAKLYFAVKKGRKHELRLERQKRAKLSVEIAELFDTLASEKSRVGSRHYRPDLTGDETGLPETRPTTEIEEEITKRHGLLKKRRTETIQLPHPITETCPWPPKNEILRSVVASIARGE